MSKRGHVYYLLDDLGMAPGDTRRTRRANRDYLLKEHIEKICDLFELEFEDTPTKADMRQRIREDVINRGTRKHAETEFSSSELLAIRGAVRRLSNLDADDVEGFEPEIGQEVQVDDEIYTVSDYEYGHVHDAAAYDRYLRVDFGDRERLMILYGLDTSECKYTDPVILEYARDYGPYKRWKKDRYVEELEGKKARIQPP